MRFSVVLLVACLAIATALPALKEAEYDFLFSSWTKQHGKVYSSAEFLYRQQIFRSNLDYVRAHNAKPYKTHTLAMNKFGDMPNEEFVERFTGLVHKKNTYFRSLNEKTLPTVGLPASVDWNAAGKVTAVKNQGQCGSCWSFSTTGSVEAAYAIQQKTTPISLSEQQLVDCSTSYGNQGCNGGLMDDAFQYIINGSGLCSESDYPYTAADGQCQTTCTPQVGIKSFVDVPVNNEKQLQAAVAQQPVSVAVDASGLDWQFYSSGVVQDACGTQLDHGVLAAGYGTLSGVDYWYVKNSWGADWGDAGYILLKRSSSTGQPGECGIAEAASYPLGAFKVGGH